MADIAVELVMPALRAVLMDLKQDGHGRDPLDRRAPLLRLDSRADSAEEADLHLSLGGSAPAPDAAERAEAIGAAVDALVDAVKKPLSDFVADSGELPRRLRIDGLGDVLVAAAGKAVGGPGAEGFDADAFDPAAAKASVSGKVCAVTGGAQGFGAEIARGLAAAGAYLVLIDLNLDGARSMAESLNDAAGRTVAVALEADVSKEESVAAAVRRITALAGGIDLFISNAGVLKAGSVKELSVKDFDFVTSVNYKGFFVCTKQVSRVLAAQDRARMRAAETPYFSDIVQVNSKSGLDGSNKNGAYAGSKFGGIGLVQSFAKELVENHVKVNAVCPGNFFDGPLWSDPERGLFVQYLRAGKVPGAETIADVKRFYEQKVPMGRGCTGPDVVKAILYAVDQRYETGQAIPVTGGQVMLS
jgi:sorbitol-6-phosphate 2-dehydrogenase